MRNHTNEVGELSGKGSMDHDSETTIIPKLTYKFVQQFKKAGSKGLDNEEFCAAMEQTYGPIDRKALNVLHMKMDTDGDNIVHTSDLLNFMSDRTFTFQNLEFKTVFPRPIEFVPVHHRKKIIRLLFSPISDEEEGDNKSKVPIGQPRTFQKGQYISMTSDGVLTFWTEKFDKLNSIPLAQEKRKRVTDMVYLRQLSEVAVSTTDREVEFYNFTGFSSKFVISHSLMVESSIANCMSYWSNDKKAVFSIGDVDGYLSVFVSHNIQANGLFCPEAYKIDSLRRYKTVHLSTLLENTSAQFVCVRIHVFYDVCSQIRYFPILDSISICSKSCKTMVFMHVPNSPCTSISKSVFESRGKHKYFSCVEYVPSGRMLVTGGTDGILRTWRPERSMSWLNVMKGHVKRITNIMYNEKDRILISLSEDLKVSVWSDTLECKQTFYVQGMGDAPISSVYYNTHNNEFVLANSDIGKYLGPGTDVFKSELKSHSKPLCAVLYHSTFKQVISACQSGVVTVWDILTGDIVIQFRVTPPNLELTAMTFDEKQRRIITVSKDGRVRLWNFNSGTMLTILSGIVPWDVTGMVCSNNRLFLSAKNCKTIFGLDLRGRRNQQLEHNHLQDISSLAVHDGILFSISSNGNIVLWDVDTGMDLACINVYVAGPQIHLANTAKARIGKLPFAKTPKPVAFTFKSSINYTSSKIKTPVTGNNTGVKTTPHIIYLKTRVASADTATMLIAINGHIYAWSHENKKDLFGKFRAVRRKDAVITTMSTDASEQILLTGDSTGRISVWDIQEFGIKNQAVNGQSTTESSPPLLYSWKSHSMGVVSIACDPTCEIIMTAGLDCNVWLWSRTGYCIGLFGRDQWDATHLCPDKNIHQKHDQKIHKVETLPPPTPLADLKEAPGGIKETPETPETTPEIKAELMLTDEDEEDDQQEERLFPETESPQPPIANKMLHQMWKGLSALNGMTSGGYKSASNQYQAIISDRFQQAHNQQPQTTLPTGQTWTTARTKGSDRAKDRVQFPPVFDGVQPLRGQCQSKLHPTRTPSNTGQIYVTKRPLHRQREMAAFIRRSEYPRDHLPQTASGQTFQTIRCPETLGAKLVKGPECARSQVRLPPISAVVKGMEGQLKPHPPQTPCRVGATLTKRTQCAQTRLRLPPITAVVKGMEGQLKPHPPQTPCRVGATLTKRTQCAQTRLRLPPISSAVQSVSIKSQFKPHPPHIPTTTDQTTATKILLRPKIPPAISTSGPKHAKTRVRFPPISNAVQSELIPQPPPPLFNTCRSNIRTNIILRQNRNK